LSDKEERKKGFQRFFVMGAFLLVGSVVVWLIPAPFLGSINERISFLELKDSLTEPQQQMLDELQWEKIWWETRQATMFNPISTLLLVIGIVLIAYGLIVRFA